MDDSSALTAPEARQQLTDQFAAFLSPALAQLRMGDKDRTVPLNADVRTAVSAYLKVRPTTSTTHLFIGQRGDPLQEQAVQNLVHKYATRAGLEGVTPRTLRHSFAKHLLDAGRILPPSRAY